MQRIERNAQFILKMANALFRPFQETGPRVQLDINRVLNEALKMASLPPDVQLARELDPELPTVESNLLLLDIFLELITNALRAGFRKQDIVLVTWTGRGRSRLLGAATLGPHRLQSFAGRYDMFGNPEYREGDLLVDSVYRFKGQSAPCVVLTEVDFESLDEAASRKLFVGMTRASMRLTVVLSTRAARELGFAGVAGHE